VAALFFIARSTLAFVHVDDLYLRRTGITSKKSDGSAGGDGRLSGRRRYRPFDWRQRSRPSRNGLNHAQRAFDQQSSSTMRTLQKSNCMIRSCPIDEARRRPSRMKAAGSMMCDQQATILGGATGRRAVCLILAWYLIASFLWRALTPAYEYPMHAAQVMEIVFDLMALAGLIGMEARIAKPLFWIALIAGLGLFAIRSFGGASWWTGHIF
jgi:hypothetical protein